MKQKEASTKSTLFVIQKLENQKKNSENKNKTIKKNNSK